MNERYWIEQIARKDAEIKELNERVNEGQYYKGLYIGLKDGLTPTIVMDDTFEDVLTEKDLEKIAKADKKKK